MAQVSLACEAMATRFELVLIGDREVSLRGAGEEAIEEIRRIEAALSLYRPSSQIAAVNRTAAEAPVRVTPEVFRLVEHALLLSQATQGAFDITVAPLLRAWGLLQGSGCIPSPRDLAEARACIGPHLVGLNPEACTITFHRPGVLLDLGSIGKGYGLDRAAEVLREAGVTDALLHGGTSSIIGMGTPADQPAWKVAIPHPPADPASIASPQSRKAPPMNNSAPGEERPLAVVELRDTSLSVSAVWGKGFRAGDRFLGHVMDPRLGEPVSGAVLAAVVLPSATESDALSTALLVRGREMVEILGRTGGGPPCLVVERGGNAGPYRVTSSGIPTRVE